MMLTQIGRAGIAFETGGNGTAAAGNAPEQEAVVRLLAALRALDYDFTAPTPASQARVFARPDRRVGTSVADLLGWSLPCRADDLPDEIVAAVEAAGLLDRRAAGLVQARGRVSSVFGNLFVHFAYPTLAEDAVFLGPDSHRFADYILRNIADLLRDARILDDGAGAWVGGVTAATAHGPSARLTLADVNPKALFLASANARFAGVDHETVSASTPADVEGPFDLIVTPSTLHDGPGAPRLPRRGRPPRRAVVARLDLAALAKLAPGGRFVMHTGVAIVAGRDVLRDALRDAMPVTGYDHEYRVFDPDSSATNSTSSPMRRSTGSPRSGFRSSAVPSRPEARPRRLDRRRRPRRVPACRAG